MNKKIKYIIIFVIFAFPLLWEYNQYAAKKGSPELTYHTKHESSNGVMIIGGMAKNKDKIDSFKDSLEEESFSKLWDTLDLSNKYRKEGNIVKAIEIRKEALQYAKGKGDQFQVHSGLARLYNENKQYDLAIKEYEWCIDYSNRPDVIVKFQHEIKNIKKIQAENASQK